MTNSYAGYLSQRECWEEQRSHPDVEQFGYTKWDRNKTHGSTQSIKSMCKVIRASYKQA